MSAVPLQLTPQAQHEKHPDLLTAPEAVAYLRIDEACPSLDSAHRLLDRLCQSGELSGITWAQARLYSRRQLDGLLQRSIDAAEAARLAKLAEAAAVELRFDQELAAEALRMEQDRRGICLYPGT